MSNDDSVRERKHKSNNELDDYKNNDDDDDDTDDESEDDTDDESDDDGDDGSDDGNFDDEELTAPTIKSKRAKPRRRSTYANKEISEVKKSNGVKSLSDKLNNNLHQIQIALPYGQVDPQRLPPGIPGYDGPVNAYDLTGQVPRRRRRKFYEKRWFRILMIVIIALCCFTLLGMFAWKYYVAMQIIHYQGIEALSDDGLELQDLSKSSSDDELSETNPLDDREYARFGNANTANKGTKITGGKGNKPPSLIGGNGRWKDLPRDSRGRFMKRN